MKILKSSAPRFTIAVILAATFAVPIASGKDIYKVTESDGSTRYTDVRSANDSNVELIQGSSTKRPAQVTKKAGINTAGFDKELRDATKAYPVTLYTTDKCDTCNMMRSHLNKRGIPFIEYQITSESDFAKYREINPSNSFPLLKVGGHTQSGGYQENNLNNLLDAASYPKESHLPRNYKNPSAQSLTQPEGSEADTAAQTANQSDMTPIPAATLDSSNPTGIRF